jgi:hypothetical protein
MGRGADGGRAEDDRGHDALQRHVHVAELGEDPAALRALVQVRAYHCRFPLGQAAPHVRTELGGHRAALVADRAGQVHLQVGLAQALARPVGRPGLAGVSRPGYRGCGLGPRAPGGRGIRGFRFRGHVCGQWIPGTLHYSSYLIDSE